MVPLYRGDIGARLQEAIEAGDEEGAAFLEDCIEAENEERWIRRQNRRLKDE